MVKDQVHDNTDSLFICLTDQTIHILHAAILRIDLIIIRHIIAIVHHGGFVDRSEPYGAHTQFFQMIQPLADSVQITIAVSVRVLKTVDINLVSIDLLPPCHVVHTSI